MTGFLDRLLHADKSRPSDIDAAAAMRGTTPGLLAEFERSYHANILDRKNAPTGPLGPDAKTVVESRSGHDLSDEALKEIGKHSVHELEQKYFLDVDGKVIGWGSIPGAIRWLRDLRDYCARHPDYKIIVF